MSGQWPTKVGVVVAIFVVTWAAGAVASSKGPHCVSASDAGGCVTAQPVLLVSDTPIDVDSVTSSDMVVSDTVTGAPLRDPVRVTDRRADRLDARGAAPSVVPEPASLLLLGTGLAAIAGVVRRRRRATKAE